MIQSPLTNQLETFCSTTRAQFTRELIHPTWTGEDKAVSSAMRMTTNVAATSVAAVAASIAIGVIM